MPCIDDVASQRWHTGCHVCNSERPFRHTGKTQAGVAVRAVTTIPECRLPNASPVIPARRCFLQSAMTEHELENVLSETQYVLNRWRFAASTSGFLWIQPIGPKLAPEELAGFIMLLKRGCRGDFPASMLFDFNDVEVVGAQWTMIEGLLFDLAQSIGASCRVTTSIKHPASAVLLYRTGPHAKVVAPAPAA